MAALAALAALVAAPVVAVVFALGHLPLVIATAAAVVAVGGFGWITVTRRGARRLVAAILTLLAAATIFVAFFVVLPAVDAAGSVLLVVALVVFAVAMARIATSGPAVDGWSSSTTRTTRADHPVVFMNPKSGGGKVGRFGLVEEARRRGIEPVLLGPDDDLRVEVSNAIERGADALGVAGGDGSQAIVASIAIERGLPFVCIPAGTRNHLALDLGVDRDDVVGALDAFAGGPERRVDVGLVGDRVFVNNVSFGVYGEVVQSDEYRDAKVQTAAAMLPDLLGPDGRAAELRFEGPDGTPRSTRDLVLVSNNPYEVGGFGGFGTRPRLDRGTLGILSVDVAGAAEAARFTLLELAGRAGRFPGCDAWAAAIFEVDADGPVPAGIDGESVLLEPPVRFRTCPGALRVWLAPGAPGTRPRAPTFRFDRATFVRLWDVVRGSARGEQAGAGRVTGRPGGGRTPS